MRAAWWCPGGWRPKARPHVPYRAARRRGDRAREPSLRGSGGRRLQRRVGLGVGRRRHRVHRPHGRGDGVVLRRDRCQTAAGAARSPPTTTARARSVWWCCPTPRGSGSSRGPPVVGRRLASRSHGFVVIGVMPPDFEYPRSVELWTSRWALAGTEPNPAFSATLLRDVEIVARLRPEVTLAQAAAELKVMTADLDARVTEGFVSYPPRRAALQGPGRRRHRPGAGDPSCAPSDCCWSSPERTSPTCC